LIRTRSHPRFFRLSSPPSTMTKVLSSPLCIRAYVLLSHIQLRDHYIT
jgi:hypothetical protein